MICKLLAFFMILPLTTLVHADENPHSTIVITDSEGRTFIASVEAEDLSLEDVNRLVAGDRLDLVPLNEVLSAEEPVLGLSGDRISGWRKARTAARKSRSFVYGPRSWLFS